MCTCVEHIYGGKIGKETTCSSLVGINIRFLTDYILFLILINLVVFNHITGILK
jgi:hypothetical protein